MGFKVYIIVVLLIAAVYDCKYLSVPVWLLFAGGLGGGVAAACSFCSEGIRIMEVLSTMVPGIALLVLAWLTKEQVGYGDGVLLLGMGGCMGGTQMLCGLVIALFLVFFTGAILFIFRKAGRKTKVPFAPFLAIGSILTVGGSMLFG